MRVFAGLLTEGKLAAPKGECMLREDDLLAAGEGQLLLCIPPDDLDAEAASSLARRLSRWRSAFPASVYLVASNLLLGDDQHRIEQCDRVARRVGIPLLAANHVLMHEPGRAPLADVLASLREKTTIDRMGRRAMKNAERHLKPETAMRDLFASHPEAVQRIAEVVDRVDFSLDQLRLDYPSETGSDGASANHRLRSATEQGLKKRYPGGVQPSVRAQVDRELELVEKLGVAPYFLTVYDLVRFARSKEILCQGRRLGGEFLHLLCTWYHGGRPAACKPCV